MNYFDLLNIVIIGIFAVTGFYRGFIKEIFGLILIICAIYLSNYFSPPVKFCLDQYLPTLQLNTIMSYIIVFIFTILFVKAFFIFNIFSKIKFMNAGLDGLLGGLFGLTKGLLLVTLLFAGISTLQLDDKIKLIYSSHSYSALRSFSNVIFKIMHHYNSREVIDEQMEKTLGSIPENNSIPSHDDVEAAMPGALPRGKLLDSLLSGEELNHQQKKAAIQKMFKEISNLLKNKEGVMPPKDSEKTINILGKFSDGMIKEIYSRSHQVNDNKFGDKAVNNDAKVEQRNLLHVVTDVYKRYNKTGNIILSSADQEFIIKELPKYWQQNSLLKNLNNEGNHNPVPADAEDKNIKNNPDNSLHENNNYAGKNSEDDQTAVIVEEKGLTTLGGNGKDVKILDKTEVTASNEAAPLTHSAMQPGKDNVISDEFAENAQESSKKSPGAPAYDVPYPYTKKEMEGSNIILKFSTKGILQKEKSNDINDSKKDNSAKSTISKIEDDKESAELNEMIDAFL